MALGWWVRGSSGWGDETAAEISRPASAMMQSTWAILYIHLWSGGCSVPSLEDGSEVQIPFASKKEIFATGQRSPHYHLWSEALIFTSKSTVDHACVIISDHKPLIMHLFVSPRQPLPWPQQGFSIGYSCWRPMSIISSWRDYDLSTPYSRHPSCRLNSSFFLAVGNSLGEDSTSIGHPWCT